MAIRDFGEPPQQFEYAPDSAYSGRGGEVRIIGPSDEQIAAAYSDVIEGIELVSIGNLEMPDETRNTLMALFTSLSKKLFILHLETRAVLADHEIIERQLDADMSARKNEMESQRAEMRAQLLQMEIRKAQDVINTL